MQTTLRCQWLWYSIVCLYFSSFTGNLWKTTDYLVYEKEGSFVITKLLGQHSDMFVCNLLSLFFFTDSYYIAMSH
jgi:hypothetical protein